MEDIGYSDDGFTFQIWKTFDKNHPLNRDIEIIVNPMTSSIQFGTRDINLGFIFINIGGKGDYQDESSKFLENSVHISDFKILIYYFLNKFINNCSKIFLDDLNKFLDLIV